jgi:hypothetical protein
VAGAVGAGAGGAGVGAAAPGIPYRGAEAPVDDPEAAIGAKGVGRGVAVRGEEGRLAWRDPTSAGPGAGEAGTFDGPAVGGLLGGTSSSLAENTGCRGAGAGRGEGPGGCGGEH